MRGNDDIDDLKVMLETVAECFYLRNGLVLMLLDRCKSLNRSQQFFP
jgi:hypothetical protein